MEKFVNGRIDRRQFGREFFRMWVVDRDKLYNSEELFYIKKNFTLTEIDGFLYLILDVFLDCELFEAEPLLREDYEISEEELRNCVNKTLLEIKDRYP